MFNHDESVKRRLFNMYGRSLQGQDSSKAEDFVVSVFLYNKTSCLVYLINFMMKSFSVSLQDKTVSCI